MPGSAEIALGVMIAAVPIDMLVADAATSFADPDSINELGCTCPGLSIITIKEKADMRSPDADIALWKPVLGPL